MRGGYDTLLLECRPFFDEKNKHFLQTEIKCLTPGSPGSHLGVCGLGEDAAHSVVVAGQAVDLHLGAHVPNPTNAVPAACHEDVQGGVELQGIHPAEVTMVLPYDLRQHTSG